MNIKNFGQLVTMLQMLSDGWQVDSYSYEDGLHVILKNANEDVHNFCFITK